MSFIKRENLALKEYIQWGNKSEFNMQNVYYLLTHTCIRNFIFPLNGIQLRNSSVLPQIPSPLAYTTDTLRSEITLPPQAEIWAYFHFLDYTEHPTM